MSKEDPFNKNTFQFAEPYLQQEDFEAIFDSFDVLGIQTIPVKYLEQGLKVVGVENAKEILEERYEELVSEGNINKVSFVFVLQTEHKRQGFLKQEAELEC